MFFDVNSVGNCGAENRRGERRIQFFIVTSDGTSRPPDRLSLRANWTTLN